jgi:phenylacetate-CoA ligase
MTKNNSIQYHNQTLQELLQYVALHSPYYSKLFAAHSIDVSTMHSVADMFAIPPTRKEDVQQYNVDFLCVPQRDVVEYAATSGTLGSPVTIALTDSDLQRLAYNEYNSFITADGSADDIYQLMLTLDRQFMAGIAYYSGLRMLGAGVIRLGPGVPSLQWETIARLLPTTIIAVPSFILKLIKFAGDNDIDINSSSVTKAICIGENIRNADLSLNVLGKKITDAWDIKLYSTYASTEMQTAFTECNAGMGGHHFAELLVVELLDEDDRQVPPRTPGELTITTLGVEGMPLIRYKTGDICMYFDEPCSCGRNSWRISPILGRKQQMIKFKGTTLYPPALFDILNERDEIREYVVEVYSNEVGLDEVLIYIVPAYDTEDCDRSIRAYLQARLRVSPSIKYVTTAAMQQMQFPENLRKPVKFVDKR